jgi:PKD repeat protein
MLPGRRRVPPGPVPFTLLALFLGLLPGCGAGDGIVLPGDAEPAAIVVLRGDGQRGRVGERLNDPVVVQVTDSRGRVVEGARVAFDFSSAAPGAAVVPEEETTNSDGVADAVLVLGRTIGQQTGQARLVLGEGREPIQAPFSAMALPENANTMAAVAGQDQTGHVGLPLDDRLVVEVTDGFGNPVAGVPISWVAVGGGSVSEAVVETDEDGRSRVDRILGPTVGQQTTLASSEGLAGSPVTFVHTALSGDASRLVVISGNDQTGEAGSMLPAELVVQLIDADGNGVPSTAVSWVVATGGGNATPEISSTDGDGRTSSRWTLGAALGEQRLDAVVSGVGIASFRATATAGAPASLFIRTQPSASASNGVRLAQQPVIQLRDAQGNDVGASGVQVTAQLDGGGELEGTIRRSTDASGRATFDDLAISGAPGKRRLSFTATGYAQVTSSEIDLRAMETTTTITADTPDPSVSGSAVTVSFRVTSGGGTPTGRVTVDVNSGPATCSGDLSGGSGSCQITLNGSGDRILTATYSGGPGFSGSSDTEPHTVTATPPPQPAGTTTTITADTPDPSLSGAAVTVSFQVTSGSGTPTGSVTVDVNSGPATCSGDLSGGSGSCQITLNGSGDRILTATYSGGPGFSRSSDTEPHQVNRPEPSNEAPDADFRWHCEDLTCFFTDRSEDDDGTIDGRHWDFGDGKSTDNELNPSHTYAAPGDYRVKLTVTDNGGLTDDAEDTVDPEAPPPPNQVPTAAFTWTCDDLECEFENQSSDGDGRIEDHDWTFGDGDDSDREDPDHRYEEGGTYQVTLTVTDNDQAENSVTHAVTVAAPPPPNQEPTAAFTPTCGERTCSFDAGASDDDDGTIVSYSWNFGDGTSGTGVTTSHTYNEDGTFTVTLTVTDDDDDTDDASSSVTVSAPPPPNEAPTAAFTSACVDLTCSFDATASDDEDGTIENYSWNFGDGETGTGETPSHTYAAGGTYTVALTVTDDDGDTDTETSQVTVPPPAGVRTLGLRAQPATQTSSGERRRPHLEIELRDAGGNSMEIEG